jgi:hypothetical protein
MSKSFPPDVISISLISKDKKADDYHGDNNILVFVGRAGSPQGIGNRPNAIHLGAYSD